MNPLVFLLIVGQGSGYLFTVTVAGQVSNKGSDQYDYFNQVPVVSYVTGCSNSVFLTHTHTHTLMHMHIHYRKKQTDVICCDE